MKRILAITALLLIPPAALLAADLELTETLPLPQCHSLSWVNAWVKAGPQATDQKGWDGILDEARWGVPSPQQRLVRNWDFRFSDEQWAQAVKQQGEGQLS